MLNVNRNPNSLGIGPHLSDNTSCDLEDRKPISSSISQCPVGRFALRSRFGKRWRFPMQAPFPVPLQDPWSPVGYQVVEVASEPAAVPLPSSPVGYRVVVVA